MEPKQLLLLLPCHSLEDFPTHHRDEEALDLQLAWTTLWHPQLLVATGKMPAWCRCEQPPDDCRDHLILIPEISQSRLPSGFLERCEEQGGFTCTTTQDRQADALRLLEQISPPASPLSEEDVAEFYALSYTYLQIQLLTRQLRYSSNLDEVHFETQLLKAARALCDQQREDFELALDRCYDVLSEERHRYYPMDSYLVDLTLLAPTTLGTRLQEQLNSKLAHNYVVNVELMERLREKQPELFQKLAQQCEAKQAYLIGGGCRDDWTGLLSYQSLMDDFAASQTYFEQHFGSPLRIYARRTAGLEQTLPSVLAFHGYHAALHEVFEDGKIYETTNTNFRWEGPDGQFLNSLTKTILDAQQPNVFLRLGIQIGEALDVDHLAVMQLVHWPGQVCPLYEDLVRSASRSNALGTWTTLDHVFSVVHEPGYSESTQSTDYRAPYLRHLATNSDGSTNTSPLQLVKQRLAQEADQQISRKLAGMLQLSQGSKSDPTLALASDTVNEFTGDDHSQEKEQWAKRVVQRLTEDGDKGLLLINPVAQAQRVLLTAEELKGKTLATVPIDQIYHTSRGLSGTWAVLDVPPMGYLHLPAGKMKIPTGSEKADKSSGKILIGQTTLRNEFLEATIDPDTGGLRSVHNYEKRGNLCSLQLAWHDGELKKLVTASLKKESTGDWRENLLQLWKSNSDPREKQLAAHVGGYSRMEATSVQTILNNSAVAEVRVQGHLKIRRKTIADILIDYKLVRGSRFLEVHAQINPHDAEQTIKIDKQRSYAFPPAATDEFAGFRRCFTWRLAHAQPAADQFRDLNSLRQRAPHGTFVAPYFVEWNGEHRLTWSCQGQPFHRIPADGKLDTLVGTGPTDLVHSEVAIGLGPNYSQTLAQSACAPVLRRACGALRSGMPEAAWFFQISTPHVALIDWQNLYHEQQLQGCQIRLLETNGRQRSIELQLTMPPRSVTVQSNDPNYQPSVKWEDCQVSLNISPFEMLQLNLQF